MASSAAINVGVTGVGGGVGQSVIRALRLSAVPVRILGMDADPWAVGLYQCDSREVIPAVRESEPYDAAIIQAVERHHIRALIPGTDTELLALSTLQPRLSKMGCTTIVSSQEFIRIARDKLLSYTALRAAGIPFVETASARDFLASYKSAAYPVIVKPKDGSASVGAKVLHDPHDVERTDLGDDDIVQSYLVPTSWSIQNVRAADVLKQGRLRQEDEISVQAVVAPDGTIASIFASINELRDGVPTKACPTLDPDIIAFSRSVFEAFVRMGHRGPVNIQGRMTGNGIVLYEINPRFTGITVVRAALGWNEVEAALRLFVLGETADSVAPLLRYDGDTVCLRYITEHYVPLRSVQKTHGA